MKICNKCKESKSIENFYNNKRYKDGKTLSCKGCMDLSREKRARTKEGLATVLYCSQKANSKRRGDAMPNYTKQEFKEWLFSQPTFEKLYNKWAKSKYKKDLRPSPDRDSNNGDYDYLPYALNRLRLTTAGDNLRKSHKDRKEGINNKFNKSVIQLTKDGKIVTKYHSMKEAERKTNINQSTISLACSGKLKTAGGYCWEYKNY